MKIEDLSILYNNSVAVGWLGSDDEFKKGAVPKGFVDKLLLMRQTHRVRQMRGFYTCKLPNCPKDRFDDRIMSSAEIEIKANGKVYRVPELIGHYVQDHEYLPPREFVDVVMSLLE